jgi:hypothetical protein
MMPNKILLRAAVLVAIAISWRGVAWAQPQSGASAVSTPAPGSPTRRAILDALRAKLDIKSVFEVYHLKVAGRWAYLRCNEVVFADGEKQETDLTVAALFERREGNAAARWSVVELWTLPTDESDHFKDFVRRVQTRQGESRIPAAIFPDDY